MVRHHSACASHAFALSLAERETGESHNVSHGIPMGTVDLVETCSKRLPKPSQCARVCVCVCVRAPTCSHPPSADVGFEKGKRDCDNTKIAAVLQS